MNAEETSPWREGAARQAWMAGRTSCPCCGRIGCRGECECPCENCGPTRPPGNCTALAELRHLQTPEGREAERAAYRAQAAAAPLRPDWGECISQTQRIGATAAACSFARKPDNNRSLIAAKDWWLGGKIKRPMLALMGNVGIGKTVAAVWICAKLGSEMPWWRDRSGAAKLSPVVWVAAAELQALTMLRAEDQAMVDRAHRAGLLVVDDASSDHANAGHQTLCALLCARMDSMRPTVLTTNVARNQSASVFGSHFADRLAQFGVVPALEAKSLRSGR